MRSNVSVSLDEKDPSFRPWRFPTCSLARPLFQIRVPLGGQLKALGVYLLPVCQRVTDCAVESVSTGAVGSFT